MSTVARTACVAASFGHHHLVEDETGASWLATRRGRRGDLAVGDRVRIALDRNATAVIESVLPRANVLKRADGVREKTLAANVDLVAVVLAAQPAFNPRFVWSALLAARGAGIDALVVLNKRDLADGEAAQRFVAGLAALGHDIVAVSAKFDHAGTRAALLPRLQARTTLLVGQSGMGKSTLLNVLVPDAGARTREYSTRLNLGKQTTSATRRFALPEGGAIVDSPGFQSFGLAHLTAGGLAQAMPEVAARHGQCRFLDCRHVDEPGCAVRAGVEVGDIDAARYSFYRDMMRERP